MQESITDRFYRHGSVVDRPANWGDYPYMVNRIVLCLYDRIRGYHGGCNRPRLGLRLRDVYTFTD
jgi:hypothetical protein